MRSMMQQMGQGGFPGMPGMFGGMGNPFAGDGNRPSQPGWRNTPGINNKKAKKKDKKKKGFGTL
jgi:signal recognition particle subunit SRP54